MSEGNDAQIQFWNGAGGETWVRAQVRLDAMLAPVSEAVLEHAGALDGQRVLDVGCGCGATALEAVARGAAHVHGVDVSEPMLALARTRAGGDTRLAFSVADAAVAEFDAAYDLILSRFGPISKAKAYVRYRDACGRDQRVRQLWGSDAPFVGG